MNGNYIKVSRSLLDWCWYHDVNTCRLFIHMLLRVNWKRGYFGEEVIERGSFVSSISKLSAETGLSEREVRTALEHLKKTGEVTCKWIPISEHLPEDESYILVSFENATMPDIARYEENDEGGTFYPGDDEKSYSSYGIFVNAWMPLPEPYKEKTE